MVRLRWAPNCSRSPSSTPPNCRRRCTARRCATFCRSRARTPTPWSLTETRTAFHNRSATVTVETATAWALALSAFLPKHPSIFQADSFTSSLRVVLRRRRPRGAVHRALRSERRLPTERTRGTGARPRVFASLQQPFGPASGRSAGACAWPRSVTLASVPLRPTDCRPGGFPPDSTLRRTIPSARRDPFRQVTAQPGNPGEHGAGPS